MAVKETLYGIDSLVADHYPVTGKTLGFLRRGKGRLCSFSEIVQVFPENYRPSPEAISVSLSWYTRKGGLFGERIWAVYGLGYVLESASVKIEKLSQIGVSPYVTPQTGDNGLRCVEGTSLLLEAALKRNGHSFAPENVIAAMDKLEEAPRRDYASILRPALCGRRRELVAILANQGSPCSIELIVTEAWKRPYLGEADPRLLRSMVARLNVKLGEFGLKICNTRKPGSGVLGRGQYYLGNS